MPCKARSGRRTTKTSIRSRSPRRAALGLKVIPWTVNEPADIARVLAMNVDGLISDYPDRVRQALGR